MSGRRIFVGRLSYRATVDDLEHFFRDYGRIRDVDIKTGYGFVELDSSREAESAVKDLNGRTLCGERVTVEFAKAPDWRGGYNGGGGGGGGGGGRDNYRDGGASRKRFGPPERTEHRLIIQNLSSRVSWQTLKDIMRKAGEVSFADAHRNNRNEAIVEFTTRSGLKKALEKFDGYELYDRRLKVFEDRNGSYDEGRNRKRRNSSRSRSRSRSRTPKRRYRSRSRSSRSRSSRTPPKGDKKHDSSRSPSVHNGKESSRSHGSRSRSHSRGSRSVSPRGHAEDNCDRSKSPSPEEVKEAGSHHSRSGSVDSDKNSKDGDLEREKSVESDYDHNSDHESRSRSQSPSREED